jgi:signal peptidase I
MADNKTTGTGTSDAKRNRTYAEIRAERDGKKPQAAAVEKMEWWRAILAIFGIAAVASGAVPGRRNESWIRSLLYAGLIAFIIRTFFFEAFRIPSGSMKNTLLVGDHLFVNKIGYFIETPKYIPFTTIEIPHLHLKTWSINRGDVVIFEWPGNMDEVIPRERKVNYIKRCIGLPGDVIQIKNKQVYVNGAISPNPPESILQNDTQRVGTVDPSIFPHGAQWNKDNYGPIKIPKTGEVIPISKDNIDQWQVFIEREGHKVELGMNDQIMIDGKLATEYKVQHDYLWMMGDNRDNSLDSRFWGFAPVDNVVGEGSIIYWSWYNPPFSTIGEDDGYDSHPGPEGPDFPEESQSFHTRWDRIGKLVH